MFIKKYVPLLVVILLALSLFVFAQDASSPSTNTPPPTTTPVVDDKKRDLSAQEKAQMYYSIMWLNNGYSPLEIPPIMEIGSDYKDNITVSSSSPSPGFFCSKFDDISEGDKSLLSLVYQPILESLDGLLDFNNADKDVAKYNDDLRASLFDLLFPNGVVYNIVAKNNNDKQQQETPADIDEKDAVTNDNVKVLGHPEELDIFSIFDDDEDDYSIDDDELFFGVGHHDQHSDDNNEKQNNEEQEEVNNKVEGNNSDNKKVQKHSPRFEAFRHGQSFDIHKVMMHLLADPNMPPFIVKLSYPSNQLDIDVPKFDQDVEAFIAEYPNRDLTYTKHVWYTSEMLQCKEDYFNAMLRYISEDKYRTDIEKVRLVEYQALSEEVEKIHIKMQELAVEIAKDKDIIKKRIQQEKEEQKQQALP